MYALNLHRWLYRFWLLIGLLLLGSALPIQPAQGAGFLITIRPGNKDLPLALPFPHAAGDAGPVAAEIWKIVRHDLELSGYFDILEPETYLDRGKGTETRSIRWNNWRLIGAAALAKMRVTIKNGKLRTEIYVFDVGAGNRIHAKAFEGTTQEMRHLGHRMADEILEALTGTQGFFGTRIATVGMKSGNKEIYLMDIDGHNVTRVTRNGSINLSPAWSPNGKKLAWTSYKRGNPDLYVKSLATGSTHALSNRPGINAGADFAPGGQRVALARSTGADTDIYVIESDTGREVQRLTRGRGIDVAPDFSPDGTHIAYASERSGGSQIYLQNLRTGEARRVTFQGGFNSDPVFSPDGTKIAFVGRDRHFDVFVVNISGKNMTRITQNEGNNEDPSWSPDGRYLLFSSTRDGRSRIWLSTSDGRHQMPVTSKSGGWTQPAWGPRR
jgi:TolB protein